MAQSLSRVLLHIIFSTKNRRRLIDPEIAGPLYGYMAGIHKQLKCPSLLINGTDDHIHALCHLARTISIAKLIEEVKKSSSKWIKTKGQKYKEFAWQSGYGAFSVSPSNVEDVRRYIQNQQEHHKRVTFQDEYRDFLQRHGIEYDERYVWD